METQWFADSAFWIGFINIIIADIVLSGDNAVVIGMAARKLPEHQRKKAIILGAGAAVLLRATLTAVATYLLKIPLLMTIGGLLLLWIAVKLMHGEDGNTHVAVGSDMKSAIKTIIVADVVMSLDNVLAVAGAAHGNVFLVLFGLALSIPLIMWGSKLIASIMNKMPWLIYVGAGVLGFTAGQMMVEDPMIEKNLLHGQELLITGIPLLLAAVVVIAGIAWKKWNAKHHVA